MCAINGFNWNDENLLNKMNETTKNRGPDDSGIYVDQKVSLGHNRLSIIDLSPNGHQPMANEDKTILITYNGEIYNFHELRDHLVKKGHVFQSHTDTEMIIHAYEEYGLEFVNKFNGMWAFCIYDMRKGQLILSRDQFGIKPLYYYLDDKRFIFSSMISGILCHNIKTSPNDRAIMEYLAYNLEDHDTYTFFNNINSLDKGSIMIYDLNTGKNIINKWYTIKKVVQKTKDDIRESFINSVQLRLISDVPVGSCLSGGLDSSAIVFVVDKYLTNKFFTFSFIVPGSAIDESKYIKEIGKHTKSEQFFTTLDPDDFLKEVEDFVLSQEEPLTGLAPYAEYRVMKLAYENGSKVLLNGQGGDEIFAGYIYYYSYLFYDLFAHFKWYSLLMESINYCKNFKDLYPHAMFAFLLLPRFFQFALWKSVLNPWINHDYLARTCGRGSDPRWKKMSLDEALSLTLFSTAIPHLLRWSDKNSMRWSIECRLPFLDPILVERALSVEPGYKLHAGKTKLIFRESIEDLLIDMIKNRYDKIGFDTPVDNFFRDEMIVDFFKSIIYSDSFKRRPYWDWRKVEKKFTDHINNRCNAGDTIWKWINLELWLRAFFKEYGNVPGDTLSEYIFDRQDKTFRSCTTPVSKTYGAPIADRKTV